LKLDNILSYIFK